MQRVLAKYRFYRDLRHKSYYIIIINHSISAQTKIYSLVMILVINSFLCHPNHSWIHIAKKKWMWSIMLGIEGNNYLTFSFLLWKGEILNRVEGREKREKESRYQIEDHLLEHDFFSPSLLFHSSLTLLFFGL